MNTFSPASWLEVGQGTRNHGPVEMARGSVADEAPGLLERASELSWLHECAADAAQTRRGRLALVCGEAGIGKTALLRQFRSGLPRRFTVLCGACDPLFTPAPLGPLVEPVEELGGELAALVGAEARPYEVAGALLAGLRGCAPSVLILDDLQWGDEATLDVIRLLARRVESAATLVVLSFRDESVHRTHPLGLVLGELPPHVVSLRIELAGLSPATVREMAQGTPLDAEVLHARTRGNPFYVTEALAAGSDAVPPTVREAVLARIARLSEPARDLLDAVAVVPQRTEVWLLEAMQDGDLQALDECLHSGVLRADADGVVFRHELARLAVEEALPPNRAVLLHRRALAALAADEVSAVELARLAHHAEAAGDTASVLRYAPAAGEQAAALGAPREAERQYMRALRFAGHLTPEERAPLQERFAEHAYLGDQRSEAADELTEAIATHRRAGELEREGQALLLRARMLGCIGRFQEARSDADEAISVLERATPGAPLARAYSYQAGVRSNESLADGAALAERAIAVAEEVGDTTALVYALNNFGWAQMSRGQESGRRSLERSLAMAVEHGLTTDAGRAFINLTESLKLVGRWSEALTVTEAGIEYAREHGLDAWLRCLLGLRAQAELTLGRWDVAAEAAAGMLAGPTDAVIEARFSSLVVLGVVRARRGDPDSQPLLDEARELAVGDGHTQLTGEAAIACAEAAWLAGRSDTMVAATEVGYAAVRRAGYSGLVGELAVWRRRGGLIEDPPEGPLLDHHRLQLSGDGRGAAAILGERGSGYGAALALADTGDTAALREALDGLRKLGAAPAAARVTRQLRELGERAVPRGPRPRTRANAAWLTPRELEVLPLLAEGLRNAEIADRLVVSPKTVDHHVSSILRKLDVSTRGQAGPAAERLGLIER